MTTIALVGPDGAGKSTIIKELQAQSAFPVRVVYMGIRLESSSQLLPTSRLILFLRKRSKSRSNLAQNRSEKSSFPQVVVRIFKKLRSILLLTNLFAEEWSRQLLAWYYQRRRFVVVFDRHFVADFYAFNHADPDLVNFAGTRLHGFLLKFYPKPDLIIFLDAPASVLVARKPEFSEERIARLQEGYQKSMSEFPAHVTVDVSQSKDKVLSQVLQLIQDVIKKDNSSISSQAKP